MFLDGGLMKRVTQVFFAMLLWAALAVAQVIPGRYVVELTEEPLGAAVRIKGKAALSEHNGRIVSEQARVKALIERQNGQVLSSVDSLMNGLLVSIPDEEAAALASLPGVKNVYPVHEFKADLDRALPIHKVPAAWARIGGMDRAGAGIKIGILDTGITPDHPGFQDSSLKAPPGYPRASSAENLGLTTGKIIVARSYEDIYKPKGGDNARDRFGHGTAVAMCAAGVTNKGPFATITGVAPKAWIGGYKIVPLNSGSASGDVILKALDDALADGMDVINLSFGSSFQLSPNSIESLAFDRITQFGVVAVVSAGNSGPNLNTLGNFGSLPSVISAGAIQNDRFFAGSVSVAGGAPYVALPGNGPAPSGPISATVLDVSTVDSTGMACAPLPAGTATGQIALILRGVCSFESKINNAQSGGAIGAIIYAAPSAPALFGMNVGAATLPAVSVGNADGVAIKAMVAAKPSSTVTIVFDGVAYPQNPNVLAGFTSRGPNFDFSIKPDLTVVGTNVYTAAESVDPQGGIYSKDGYASVSGTSFSSPITAGAAAVLRAARPGLSVDQYRSLLINGAQPLIRGDGSPERVQQTGTGILNLDNALQNTVTAFPTSISFGIGNGTLGGAMTGDFNQLTLTNVGKITDTFRLSAIEYDSAPDPQFSVVPGDASPTSTLSLTIDPGQSKTVYVYWTTGAPLTPDEYQGQILILPAKSPGAALVPYWYGVPTGVPRAVVGISSPAAQARVGTNQFLFLRVIDNIGVPVTDDLSLAFKGSVISGGGTISLTPFLFFPNLRLIQFKLGPAAGDNVYRFSFGNLPPSQITITGTTP
jgi:minor extracellular serine protease Vpr